MSTNRKSLIYHPKQVPVEIREVKVRRAVQCESVGELAVQHSGKISVGSQVLLSLYLAESEVSLHGRVIWLVGSAGNYLIGITFNGRREAYRMRMIEQLYHIQTYQQAVARQAGRLLTDEEAAREWIMRFSKDFPEVAPVELH